MTASESKAKPTPGPWHVRTRIFDGKVVDCFVAANSFRGYAYDSEILGDDEYQEGIGRKLADAHVTSASLELLEACQRLLASQTILNPDPDNDPDVVFARAAIAKANGVDQ